MPSLSESAVPSSASGMPSLSESAGGEGGDGEAEGGGDGEEEGGGEGEAEGGGEGDADGGGEGEGGGCSEDGKLMELVPAVTAGGGRQGASDRRRRCVASEGSATRSIDDASTASAMRAPFTWLVGSVAALKRE